jgi:hypothetical protein
MRTSLLESGAYLALIFTYWMRQALNGAAYRAEVHPDISAMAQQQREDDERRATEQAEHGMKAAAHEASLKRAQALADANTVVSRAIARAGFDTTAWPPAAALFAEAIGKMLMDVQNASRPVTDTGFSAASAPSEVERGAAVSDVLAGSQP